MSELPNQQSLAAALMTYAEFWGAVHDDGCPADDTCECSGRATNEAVTFIVRHLQSCSESQLRAENAALRAERDRLVAGLSALEQQMRGQIVGRPGARHPCGSYFEFSGTLDRCEKCGWQAVAHQVWHWAEQLAALRRTPE